MMLNDLASRVYSKWTYFIAFGFGSGLLPWVPGTWGTLAAVPFTYLWSCCSNTVAMSLMVALFILGIYVAELVSRDLGTHDFSGIVWDEMVGYWLTLWGVPLTWRTILIGFVLFRFFDMVKPFPIAWVDHRVRGGLGIMLDDVLAAIPSWFILNMVIHRWGA